MEAVTSGAGSFDVFAGRGGPSVAVRSHCGPAPPLVIMLPRSRVNHFGSFEGVRRR